MARLKSNLHVPYNDLSHFLEHLPDGMSYDILQTKVPSLRALNKKDLELLLEYVAEKNRIVIIPTTQKGVVGSPILRHKMHAGPISSITKKDVSLPENTLFSTGPGRPVISDNSRQSFSKSKEEEIPVETAKEKPTIDINIIRRQTLIKPELIKAAAAIEAKLKVHENGYTRTEMAQKVMEYHHLRGADRTVVLNYLVAKENIRQVKVDASGKALSAPRFVHGIFCKDIPVGEKRFDHSAPQLTLDPQPKNAQPTGRDSRPLSTPEVQYLSAGFPRTSSRDISKEAVGEVVLELLEKVKKPLPLFRVWDYLPGLPGLDKQTRFDILNPLVEAGKINIYSAEHPNDPKKEVHWVRLILEGEDNQVVRTVGDEAPSAMAIAVMEALKKEPEEESNASKYPNRIAALNEKPISLASLEQMEIDDIDPITPVEFKDSLPVTSAADVRQRIQALERLALTLESKEQEKALVDLIKPIHSEIVAQFTEAQKALEMQIDAHAEIGKAIERMSAILNKN